MKEDLKDFLSNDSFSKLVELRARAYKSQEGRNPDASNVADNGLLAKAYNELADFFGFPKLSEKSSKRNGIM